MEITDEKKKFILIVGISGTVTIVVEAKDKDEATAMAKNFQYRLGCLEDAQTDFVEVEEAVAQDEPDKLLDAEDPLFPQKLLLVMGQAFDHADVYDLETCRNPVSKVRFPGSEGEDKDVRILQPEKTWKIVSRLQDPERTLVRLIAAAGLRIREALALQWKRVGFEADCIRVEQAF